MFKGKGGGAAGAGGKSGDAQVEMTVSPLSQHDPSSEYEEEKDDPPLGFGAKIKKTILEASGAQEVGGFDIEELAERGMAAYLLLIYGVFWMFALIYFAISITMSTVNQKYLGVELVSDAMQICEEVPLVSTGVFLADTSGNWDTSPDFQANASVFSLEFHSSLLTNQDYANVMADYSSRLKQLGATGATRGIGWNWAAWSTLNFIERKFNTRFAALGSAASMYNLEVTAAAVASGKGVCTNTIKSKTKPSKYASKIKGEFINGRFKLSYPVMNDPNSKGLLVEGWDHTKFGPCSDQGYLQDVWSWSASSSPDFQYSVDFDAQTVATIIALNLGLLKKEDLMATSALYDYNFLNLPMGSFYIDSNRVPMNAIYCLDDSIIAQGDGRPDVCFYPFGRKPLLLYPATAQIGPIDSSTGQPTNCRCNVADPTDSHYGDFNSTECNKPKVIIGMFYNIDGSANKTNGVINFAINMQKQVMLKGDYIIGQTTFDAMSDAVYLFSSNVNSRSDQDYCPGGSKDSGSGDCVGVCSFDYKTSCTTAADCARVDYLVQGDDANSPALSYKSDDGATCVFVCSTDITASCDTLQKSSPQCPGMPGMGCITSSSATNLYYDTSYNPSKAKAAIKASYPFSGSYDSTNGGCMCKGYPTTAISKMTGASSGSSSGGGAVTTDDYASSAAEGVANDGTSGPSPPPSTDDFGVRKLSNWGDQSETWEDSISDEQGEFQVLDEANSIGQTRRRRLGTMLGVTVKNQVIGKPASESSGYDEKTNTYVPAPNSGKSGLYKSWCCPGVTKCECTYQNGTAIFSPSRYSWKCCPDSTKCWCAGADGKTPDSTYKASCCKQAYDQICCDPGRSYDNGTHNIYQKMASHFAAICPDKKCAALVFLSDSTTGIFNSVNDLNIDMRQLSNQNYKEKTYKFIKATKTWVASGLKVAKRVMCVDTFFNQDVMDKLSGTPPAPLVQGYYNCHATLLAALQSAIGNAAGGASLYANIGMAIVCTVWFTLYNKAIAKDGPIVKKKVKEEREAKRQAKAQNALHSLMGTIAEEYIGMKRRVAGTVNDPGIEAMAAKLAFYRRFHPRDGDGEFKVPTAAEEEAEAAAAAAAAADNRMYSESGFESDSGSDGEDEDSEQAEAERQALVGKRVALQGLPPGSPYNGAIGKCMQYDSHTDPKLFRVTIIAPNHLRGRRVKVRFESLYKPSADEVAAARAAGPPGQDGLLAALTPACPQQ